MAGFRDIFALTMGWHSVPTRTPPTVIRRAAASDNTVLRKGATTEASHLRRHASTDDTLRRVN